MKNSVSVIIPNHNYASWLPAAIESCMQQADYLREVIIVDDHSSDNSWEVIQNYQHQYSGLIKSFRNTDKGGNNARNLGFLHASGEYIQWLDADDVILPGKLAAQTECLDSNQEIAIVYSDWQLDTFNGSGSLLNSEFKKAGNYEDYLMELLQDNWQPPHNYLMRKSIAQQLHEKRAWNPDTKAAQDREYYTRAAITGVRFAYVPGNMVIYNRRQMGSVSRVLPQRDKSAIIIQLLQNFMQEIDCQSHIRPNSKSLYKKILYTQMVYLATYYQLPMKNNKPSLGNIDWMMVKGFKSKLQVFKNLIHKNG